LELELLVTKKTFRSKTHEKQSRNLPSHYARGSFHGVAVTSSSRLSNFDSPSGSAAAAAALVNSSIQKSATLGCAADMECWEVRWRTAEVQARVRVGVRLGVVAKADAGSKKRQAERKRDHGRNGESILSKKNYGSGRTGFLLREPPLLAEPTRSPSQEFSELVS
jgi:hypothetical protein